MQKIQPNVNINVKDKVKVFNVNVKDNKSKITLDEVNRITAWLSDKFNQFDPITIKRFQKICWRVPEPTIIKWATQATECGRPPIALFIWLSTQDKRCK